MRPAICSMDNFDAKSCARCLTESLQSSYLSNLPFLFRSLNAKPLLVKIATPELVAYPKVRPPSLVTKRIVPDSISVHFLCSEQHDNPNKDRIIIDIEMSIGRGRDFFILICYCKNCRGSLKIKFYNSCVIIYLIIRIESNEILNIVPMILYSSNPMSWDLIYIKYSGADSKKRT